MTKSFRNGVSLIAFAGLGLLMQGAGVAGSAVAISLNSMAGTLNPSQILSLTATVTGSTNTGVTWSLSPNVGSLATSGGNAVYAAPAIIGATETVTVTATSMADSTKKVSALLSLVPLVSLALTPGVATLDASDTQQFTAAVSGAANQAVNWSIDPPVGSVSPGGLYLAPSNVDAQQSVTLLAQTVADPGKSASAAVRLVPKGFRFTLQSGQLSTLTYGGVDYSWPIGYVAYEFWTPPGGHQGAQIASALDRSVITGSNEITNTYVTDSAHGWTLKVVYSGAGSNTLQEDVYITNNATADTLLPYINPMAFRLPNVVTSTNPLPFDWRLEGMSPVGYYTYGSNSIAWWISPSNANYQVAAYGTGDNESYRLAFANFQDGPTWYGTLLAPGNTSHYTLYLRIGSSTQTAKVLAPEAFTSYASVFPFTVPLANKNPIARIFLTSIGTNYAGCTSINPRCYIGQTALSNPAKFRSDMIGFADQAISVMNSMKNRPQGVILWDLEGQEFRQPLSYVGDPYHLGSLAPEMDAIADSLIAEFKNAGFSIGLTIRPQHVLVGSSLPTTCAHSATNSSGSDVFINTLAVWPYRGYICSATNTWSQAGASLPSVQTEATTYNNLYADMSQKISYAINRWGASIFYVDSNGWVATGVFGPQIWRDLANEFPGITIFPEHKEYGSYGAASAYNGDQPLVIYETEQTPRTIWPNAFTLTVGPATVDSNAPKFIQAVKDGDILLCDCWYQSSGVSAIDYIYNAAHIQ